MGDRALRSVRIVAIVFLLALVVFAKFHEPTRFVHALQKLAHPVTFGAVALLFLVLLPPRSPRPLGLYVAALGLAVLCGAATEVAQAFVHRDPELLDVLRDALGAATALAGFATLIPGSDAHGRGGRRVAGALFAILGCLVMATPLSICVAAYARRDVRFPTLFEACSSLDRYFVVAAGADVEILPIVRSNPSCGDLRVSPGPKPYAGIMLEEPYPDWRSATSLVLDLDNPGDRDLPLAVRVHDRVHNLQFRDRFNREFTLHAHEQLEFSIPIAEIEHAPAGRLMDLSRIAGIAVFRARGDLPQPFDVVRIVLRR